MKKILKDDDLINVVLCIPKNAEKLKIKATFAGNHEAVVKLGREDIMEARANYLDLDPYDNAFDIYTLTDKAREEMNGRD